MWQSQACIALSLPSLQPMASCHCDYRHSMAAASRSRGKAKDGDETKLRIAIVNNDKVSSFGMSKAKVLGCVALLNRTMPSLAPARSASPRNASKNARNRAPLSDKVSALVQKSPKAGLKRRNRTFSHACQPRRCRFPIKPVSSVCPMEHAGKLCIEVTPTSKLAFISEPVSLRGRVLVPH